MTFEGTLLFALNTVGLAFVFFSHDGPLIATPSELREPPERACVQEHHTRVRSQAGELTLTSA